VSVAILGRETECFSTQAFSLSSLLAIVSPWRDHPSGLRLLVKTLSAFWRTRKTSVPETCPRVCTSFMVINPAKAGLAVRAEKTLITGWDELPNPKEDSPAKPAYVISFCEYLLRHTWHVISHGVVRRARQFMRQVFPPKPLPFTYLRQMRYGITKRVKKGN